MGKIFWGVIFAFFDYVVSNGTMYINFIPDFVGCLLIYLGIKELKEKRLNDGGYFAAAERVALPAVIFAAVLYGADLIGFSAANPWFAVLTGIVYLVMVLYILYQVLKGLMEIERNYNLFMNLRKMQRWWGYMAIFNLMACVVQLLAYYTVSAQLALIFYVCSLLAVVCEICYLVRVHAAGKMLKAC